MALSCVHDDLSKLIVNYLPKSLSEQDVQNLFSVFGKVHSCKLMVDLKTGVSKGWGFVNYFDIEDARKAVSSYNGLKMQNKVIRVAFADGTADTETQLFVSGLKTNTTQKELEDIFSEYGKVTWCYLMPKGAGLVRYERKEQAFRAIGELNGTTVSNNPFPLIVSLHQSSAGRAKTQPDSTEGPHNYSAKAPSSAKSKFYQRFSPTDLKYDKGQASTLYVSGLPPDFDEAKLYKMFSPCGAISSAAVMLHPDSKECKGVAFVTMINHEDAVAAIQSLHGISINDREVRVTFKRNK